MAQWLHMLTGLALAVLAVQWSRGWPSSSKGNALSSAKVRSLVGDLMQTEDLQKRASAAASAMYLTNIEALRPQLRREGPLSALVVLVRDFDLTAAADEDAQPSNPTSTSSSSASSSSSSSSSTSSSSSASTPPTSKSPAQPPNAGASAATLRADMFTAALIGLARLCADDPPAQALALNNGVLAQVLGAIKKRNSRWVGASALVLHALSMGNVHPYTQEAVHEALGGDVMLLTHLGMRLLEAGAYSNSSDTLVAGSRLLSVTVSAAPERVMPVLQKSDVQHIMRQVLAVHHAKNGTAEVVGSVAETFEVLVKQGSDEVLPALGEAGSLRQLLHELRPPRKPSAGPVLRLLGLAANTEAGAEQLILGGLITMCTQLFLHAEAAPAWRRSCMDIVCDLTDSPHFDAEADARSVDVEGVRDAVKIQVKGLNVTEEGTAHLIKALLGVLGKRVMPGVHVSALQALRDVADDVSVSKAIAKAGGLKVVLGLLSRHLAREGLYPGVWAAQTHRAAVTLAAVMALHNDLRSDLVQAGAIEALVQCLKMYQEGPGLAQQMRITAAAGLVSILEVHKRTGDEIGRVQLVQRAVEAGALEALLPMVNSASEQEAAVSARVVALMTRDEQLMALLRELQREQREEEEKAEREAQGASRADGMAKQGEQREAAEEKTAAAEGEDAKRASNQGEQWKVAEEAEAGAKRAGEQREAEAEAEEVKTERGNIEQKSEDEQAVVEGGVGGSGECDGQGDVGQCDEAAHAELDSAGQSLASAAA